jgi:nitroreductase
MSASSAPILVSPSPVEGEPAVAALASPETLTLLARRRSTPILLLGAPGPSRAQIAEIVRLAGRVPDHGKLAPWRFIAIEGEARARAGAAVAEMVRAKAPDTPAQAIEQERGGFLRSPASVIVVYTGKPHDRIPEWEQRVSTSMAAYQALLAAHAMGFAGVLLSGRIALDPDVRPLFGLAEHERIMGVLHLGTATGPVSERARPPARLDWY